MRLALIIFGTLLGAGTLWLVYEMPIRADMKKWAQVFPLAAFLVASFFFAVQLIDDYIWWATPALVFLFVGLYCLKQLNRIYRHIDANKPSAWLTAVMASAPVTGAPMNRKPAPQPTPEPVSFQYLYENGDGDYGQFLLDDSHHAHETDLAAELEQVTKDRDAMRLLVSTMDYALRLLVNLKDGPRDADYERDKPLAWDLARAAVAEVDELRAPKGEQL